MNYPTVPARRLPQRAVLITALVALATGCGAPVTPTRMPATSAELCALNGPDRVLSLVGLSGNGTARPSDAFPEEGERVCTYTSGDGAGEVTLRLRAMTRKKFDFGREVMLKGPAADDPDRDGLPPFTDLPGVAESAIGGQEPGGAGIVIAFQGDTQILATGTAPPAKLGELVNLLVSETRAY